MREAVLPSPIRWQDMRSFCLRAHRSQLFAYTTEEVAFIQRLGLDRPPSPEEEARITRLYAQVKSALEPGDE